MPIDLQALQAKQTWGAHDYTMEHLADLNPWRDFRHAHGHCVKALGKLFGAVGDATPHGREIVRAVAGKYLADIVICTLRLAAVFPGTINLAWAMKGQDYHDRSFQDAYDTAVATVGELVGVFRAPPGRVPPTNTTAWLLVGLCTSAEDMAQFFPGGLLDLEAAVHTRLAEKFPAKA